MDSIPCFKKVHWGTNNVLFPGTRHTEPSEMFPWECVSEIIPGLFLTCEKLAKDRENCLYCGYSLVMNFCASTYNHPYRAYSRNAETGKMEWCDFDSFQHFCSSLDEYISVPLPVDVKSRKVFLWNFAALDVPTYDMSQHFLPCSAVIELVMACRETLKNNGHGEAELHNVVVHCMVGVSRSASVVAAYLMKRAQLGVEDTMAFMQSTRPVVGPNPGFRRQLGMWELLLTLHVDGELAARLVIDELKERHNLVETVTELLPTLLETSKCVTEREFFGLIVAGALESSDQLTLIRRELLSTIAALVDSETYVDTPKFFAHICEIMWSAEKYVPSFIACFADGSGDTEPSTVWTDGAYRFVFMDLARSGYVKDTYDTTRAFSSLMEMVQSKHLNHSESACARLIRKGGATVVSSTPFIKFSFPFLHFAAPYAEGFVPYVELSDLQTKYPLSGALFTEQELEALVLNVRQLFLSRFLLSTCGGSQEVTGSEATTACGRWSIGTQLKHLEADIEVALFEELEKGASAADVVAIAQKKYFSSALVEPIRIVTGRKVVGAIVAFRVLLETAEQFVLNSYSVRIASERIPLQCTETAFPLSHVLTAAKEVADTCAPQSNAPVDIVAYFRGALEPAFMAEVIHPDGLWSLLTSS